MGIAEEDLCDLPDIGIGKMWRLEKLVSYRKSFETGDWIWKRGWKGENLQLTFLFPWPETFFLHVRKFNFKKKLQTFK